MNEVLKDVLKFLGFVLKMIFMAIFGIFVFIAKLFVGSIESATSGRNYAVVREIKAGNKAMRQRFKGDQEYRDLRMRNAILENQILQEQKRRMGL